ncbi:MULTISPECIES: SDR family oxidoreductase [unclassified Thermoplasma]|uniref:SDR family oxidoreductase n=1 Tax=unclassified Thermoplasma TaxID=2684908 RepID=UPI000D93D22C|nr:MULTISPECIES: SDR family oxidoreductase [unclassified Thermoplasma]PYB68338.1 3-oxoacyl-ACP reductase [Thermoplasma sp. Kam2015]
MPNVIVSAASSGIGKGIAEVLARCGYKMTLFSRDENKLQAVKNVLKSKYGNEPVTIGADLSRSEDIGKVLEKHREIYGSIENLVVNYGDPRVASFLDLSEDDWKYALDMILMSTIRLTREALKDMIRLKGGSIVYVTSMTVREPMEGFSLSSSIRSAVVSLAKNISLEVSKFGVRINTISQGYVNTDRLRDVIKNSIDRAEGMRRLSGDVPLRRVAEPEEIGEVVEFLLSDRSSYINGANIPVDGGITKFPL